MTTSVKRNSGDSERLRILAKEGQKAHSFICGEPASGTNMADFSTYHSLGQGEEDMRTAGVPPQFNPPIAQEHPSYQHNKSPHGDNLSPMGTMDSAGYSSGLPGETQGGDTMGGLSSQMGGLGISGAMGGSVRTHKKKDRHAYHDIGVPSPTSQTFNGMAQGGIQLQSGMNPQLPPSSPYPHLASPGSQHPLQSGQPFGGSAKFSSAGDGSVSTQGKVDPEQVPGVPIARDVAAHIISTTYMPRWNVTYPPPALSLS
ncbi:conserved hypothetical protein [Histoplasma mississippiense (nom. inval.)]|uniref:conserved hypothetical protein n=1 Tax=Ajellomyces capsulatus (strain NAm1 / WU24) TaxID=2059318 RepID=UPI000157C4D4|nr:conserved hypothetical protein [Histoplasma mississippiense (nom. inval.)]EDN08944.1 conserved hypothetical protein [Histoplasma mississippiense (nom. inval.)]